MKSRMILVTALVLAAFSLAPFPATASDRGPLEPQNELSVEVGLPIVLNLVLQPDGYAIPVVVTYQRVVADPLVLSVTPTFLYGELPQPFLIALLWLELDWHPSRHGLGGFFVGPAVATMYVRAATFGFGVLAGGSIGYQFLLPSNIDLNLSIGAVAGLVPGYSGTAALPRGAITLGYRF